MTSLTPLPNVNRFIAATTENVLRKRPSLPDLQKCQVCVSCIVCYDLSAASDPLQVITGFPHCVVAMDYW